MTAESQTEELLPINPGKTRRKLVKDALGILEREEELGQARFRYWNLVEVVYFPDPEGEIDRAIDIARSIHEAGIAKKIMPLLEDDL